MPRPVFDIEQYELRGTLPEVYTDAQKKALNETLARVNGQIDWTAQLLGFSGPNYWGRPNPKNDGTYNWTGLVETMNEKRQMQVGTYGVFNKHLDYTEWPTPLNREHIGASGDAAFHLFVKNELTQIAPLGQGEDCDYMHEPAVFGGGSYVFDADLEIRGKEIDIEQYLTIDKFIENERTWTRVLIKSEAVGGTLEVRRSGTTDSFCPLEILHWKDISDWKSESTRDLYIGLWGNKGAAVSFDFSFDALDLHGFNEQVGLVYADNRYVVRPAELLEKVGQKETFWTLFSGELFSFHLDGCDTPFPVISPYINEPYAGHPWEPVYIEDGHVFMECDANCDYTVIGRQYLSEEDNQDNGEYQSFCDPDPNAFTDCVEQIIPLKLLLNNGTLEDEIPTSGTKDEGEYDRTPWRTIDRFEFEYIPKTDCAYVTAPCLEMVFNTELDNGEMEDTALLATQQCHVYDAGSFDGRIEYECELDNGTTEVPLPWPGNRVDSWEYDRRLTNCTYCPEDPEDLSANLINAINTGGPSSGVEDGVYDKIGEYDWNEGSLWPGCIDDQWRGYDDGEYDENVEPNCGDEGPTIYNNGLYAAAFRGEEYDECKIDNEKYEDPDTYLGPQNVDSGELNDGIPDGCTYVDGAEYVPDYNDPNATCATECLEVDQGTYDAFFQQPCNKVDGKMYDVDEGPEEPSPEPPVACAEKCPEVTACPADIVFVNLAEEFASALQHKMLPDLRNAYSPLRTWKDRVLANINQVPNSELEDHNFLVADQNCGATPEDSYRHFVRLPLEYPRDGKEWNRAVSVCDNISYFSTPSKLSGTLDPPRDLSPRIYSESYQDAEDYEVFYEEDFLVSSISSDFSEVAPGFEDSGVFSEEDASLPFVHAIITDYEPMKSRIPDVKGEWKGTYYVLGVNADRTGHVSQDLATYSLIELDYEEYPRYDFSIIKRPNVQFPDESGAAAMKNYVVSYAYFAADFSASDDPVFDPNKSQCWRESVLDCLETTPDGGACQAREFHTNTQYILHPTT